MITAAAPAWFAENVVLIAAVTLGVATLLIVRLVQKLAVRVVLLGIVAAMALFVYANRLALQEYAETCECKVADRDISIPGCDVDLSG